MDIMGQILFVLAALLGCGVVGLIIAIFTMNKKFNIKVIIKESLNGNKVVKHDLAKEFKKDDGIVCWKLQKSKDIIPQPPQSCIELDNKGKKVMQFYRVDGGDLIPSHDAFDPNELSTKEKIIEKIQPYTTNQRAMLVSQHLKSERNKKQSMSDMVAKALPYIAMIMLVVMFMLFFNEAVQPMLDVGSQYVTASENLVKASEKLDNAINNRITISENEAEGEHNTPEIPPN